VIDPFFPMYASNWLFIRHKSLSKEEALDEVLKTTDDRLTLRGTP